MHMFLVGERRRRRRALQTSEKKMFDQAHEDVPLVGEWRRGGALQRGKRY